MITLGKVEKPDYSAQIAECQRKLAYLDSEISATKTMLIWYENFQNEMLAVNNSNGILIQDLNDTMSVVYSSYDDDGKKVEQGLLEQCAKSLNYMVSSNISEVLAEIAKKINELNNKLRNLIAERNSVQADLNWYLSQ